jgi:ABC-type transport system involved in multi-copper enzyme maturation permease subunit
MLRTLIEKELKAILLSPKFIAVFTVCSILIIMSIYIGIRQYKASMDHYEAVNSNVSQQMQSITNWHLLTTTVVRYPDPMQIFVSGINDDIGRQSPIPKGSVKLYNSYYSENTIFAFFRSMDFIFIVQIVLSLFAIMFTYDSICGEREKGTLKLCFANQLPRSNYIIAKLFGSWLGLVIPLLIPLSLGIMLILLYNVPMTIANWIQLFLLIGVSFLYFSFFICLGVLFSTLTRESSTSFLYLLIIWISFVLIIPRIGVMIAGQCVSVPTSEEMSLKLSQKNKELANQLSKWIEKKQKGLTLDNIQQFMMKDLKERQDKFDQDRDKYDAFLNEDWRNRKSVQEKLGFSLSRFSPSSAFKLAAMDLAGTGLKLKANYEDQIRNYRDIFNKFVSEKKAEQLEDIFTLDENYKPKPINLKEMPVFNYINTELKQILKYIIIDIGILSFYILITIAGTLIVFIRYDVR